MPVSFGREIFENGRFQFEPESERKNYGVDSHFHGNGKNMSGWVNYLFIHCFSIYGSK